MSDKPVILVPTDFTKVGDSAVDYAARLSKILRADIHLLHIVSKEKEVAAAKIALGDIAKDLQAKGIEAKTVAEIGNIFDDIGRVAREENAKLIVMGTHGVKGIQHVMGSKALKVVTNSDVPYVIVQNKPMREHGFKNIVVPVSFNQEVKQSLIYACEMGRYFKSKIHIVYVKEKDEFIAAKIERNIPHAENYLREQKVDYEITGIEKKDFSKDVVKFAASVDADLITIINNHENIFTYFGGSFEQAVIGNDEAIPVMVINHVALNTAYSFSIYFA